MRTLSEAGSSACAIRDVFQRFFLRGISWRKGVFLALSGGCFAGLICFAQAADAPAMAISGTMNVDQGAASYSIPILVPPGTAGLAPSVSLQYSSQGGDGIVGIGWSLQYGATSGKTSSYAAANRTQSSQSIEPASYLPVGTTISGSSGGGSADNASSGVSAITRCPQTMAQDGTHIGVTHAATDRFCLGGKRLVSTSGTYGAAGTIYHTEIESYDKIISYGTAGTGPQYFKVWAKSGLIFEYGNTSDSRYLTTTGTGTVRAWNLNKISDRKGNYLSVTYTDDTTNGQIYPSQIDYTGNDAGSLSTYNSVRFVYDTSRTDVVPLYQAGSLQKITALLTNIKTYQGSTLVRNYKLSYRLGTTTTRSRLTSVTVCDVSDNCLAPTTFGWQGSETTITATTTSLTLGSYSTYYGPEFGDINGDGIADAIVAAGFLGPSVCSTYLCGTAKIGAWYGVSGSVFPSEVIISRSITNIWCCYTEEVNYNIGSVVDFDGDGVMDVDWIQYEYSSDDSCEDDTTYCTTTPRHHYFKSDESDVFTEIGATVYGAALHNYGYGDFDGDGILDYLTYKITDTLNYVSTFYIITGDGAGTYTWSSESTPTFSYIWSGYVSSVQYVPPYTLGDTDADGISDVILLSYTGTTGTKTKSSWGEITYYTTLYVKSLVGDFNGDGATDMLTIDSDSANDNVATLTYGNSGSSSITVTLPSEPYNSFASSYFAGIEAPGTSAWGLSGDWNGDGKTDIALRTTDDTGWNLYLSTGAGFILSKTITLTACTRRNCRVADLNSDGADDIWVGSSTTGYAWISTYVPELMTSVSNGIGQETTIVYDRLNKNGDFYQKCENETYFCGDTFPTQGVNGPIYVVQGTELSNGIGGTFGLTYSYMGYKKDAHGRGMLGFSQVTKTDAQTGIVTTTNYETAFPFTGMVSSQTISSGSVTLKSVTNTFASSSLGTSVEGVTRYKVTQTKEVTAGADLSGATLPTTTESYTYDSYGNVLTDSASVSDGSSRSVTNVYSTDEDTWLISLLTKRTESRTSASSSAGSDSSNSAPEAASDSVSVDVGSSVTFDPRSNDSDTDGDTLSIVATGTPKYGTVTYSSTSLTYAPTSSSATSDSFTYSVSDGKGHVATASVSVSITGHTPTAVADSVTTKEDTAVAITPLSNDSDLDGDTLSISAVGTPSNGSVTQSGTTLTYTPTTNYNGSDSFTYTISDGDGHTASATITVTISAVNDVPVAEADSVSTDEDTAVSISPLSNDSDADGDTLSISAVGTPSNGSVTQSGTTLTYTPTTDYYGVDSFTYTVSDGNGGTDSATITVTVSRENDAPSAVADSVTTKEDTAVSISPLSNDSDVDGDTLSISAVGTPSHGSVSLSGTTVTYTPTTNYNGSDSFSYTASDGYGGTASATITVTITAVNDVPVAAADSVTTKEDTSVAITPLSNDSDTDGDTLSISAVGTSSHGSVSKSGTTLTYTPTSNYNGSDSFTYTASDGNGGTASATISVTISAVNDAPTVVVDTVTTNEDTSVSITPLSNDSDVEGDTLSISAVGTPSHGTASLSGTTITYTPTSNYNGTDSFTYTVSDGSSTSTGKITVTISAVNDYPTATSVSVKVSKGSSISIDVSDYVTDVDGDTLSYKLSTTSTTYFSAAMSGTVITITGKAIGGGSCVYSFTDGTTVNGTTIYISNAIIVTVTS